MKKMTVGNAYLINLGRLGCAEFYHSHRNSMLIERAKGWWVRPNSRSPPPTHRLTGKKISSKPGIHPVNNISNFVCHQKTT